MTVAWYKCRILLPSGTSVLPLKCFNHTSFSWFFSVSMLTSGMCFYLNGLQRETDEPGSNSCAFPLHKCHWRKHESISLPYLVCRLCFIAFFSDDNSYILKKTVENYELWPPKSWRGVLLRETKVILLVVLGVRKRLKWILILCQASSYIFIHSNSYMKNCLCSRCIFPVWFYSPYVNVDIRKKDLCCIALISLAYHTKYLKTNILLVYSWRIFASYYSSSVLFSFDYI